MFTSVSAMLQIYDWFPSDMFHLKGKCSIFFIKVPFVLQKVLIKQLWNLLQLCTFLFMVCLCGSLSWQLLLPAAVGFLEGQFQGPGRQQVGRTTAVGFWGKWAPSGEWLSGCQLSCLGVLACLSSDFIFKWTITALEHPRALAYKVLLATVNTRCLYFLKWHRSCNSKSCNFSLTGREGQETDCWKQMPMESQVLHLCKIILVCFSSNSGLSKSPVQLVNIPQAFFSLSCAERLTTFTFCRMLV